MPKYRIAIIGCGVGGATAGCLLAKQGHQVTVFERAAVLKPIGAGVLLQPSGQAILKQMGLLESVIIHAAPIHALVAKHSGSQQLLICNRYADYRPEMCSYGVHRGVLFQVLLQSLQQLPVQLVTDTEILSREKNFQGSWLKDHRHNVHGPFDVVIAADGARSHLRDWFGNRNYTWTYKHGTLWAIIPDAHPLDHLFQMVQGTRKLCGILPLGNGLSTLYWGLPSRDLPNVKRKGIEKLKEEIVLFCPQTEPLLQHVMDFEQLLFTPYGHVWMPRYFDEDTIFIGDAAHAMSPHLGQGINLAMIDAWVLSGALQTGRTPRAAFQHFHQQQRNYLRYYSLVTAFLAPFFQSDYGLLGWGRDRVLPWLPAIPWIRKQMLMTVSGLKSHFFAGERNFDRQQL